MKKLLYLFLVLGLFACSDDDNGTDTTCLTCSNANFTNELPWGEFNCDELDIVCVGYTMSSGCFPISVPPQASVLTINDINAIKALWEANGATCTLSQQTFENN